MLTQLLKARRFAPLFWCQFCSALNDNFLKNALGMLILFGINAEALMPDKDQAGYLLALSSMVFIAPFFILSALGGQLADKFDKAYVAERIKLAEIPVAAIAAVGFFLHSVPILFIAVAMFGIIGALFGPVKYGILPEKLSTEELAAGNALVEGATFLAILLGTIAGSVAVTHAKSAGLIAIIIMVLAVVCWLCARMIPTFGPAAPHLAITVNPWPSTLSLLRELKADRRLWIGGTVTSWFWLAGIVALSLLPVLIKDRMGGSESVVALCLGAFTIGIAFGSVLAARASQGRPNLALVPLGATLMGVFALAIGWIAWCITPADAPLEVGTFLTAKRGFAVITCLIGLAVGGGLYIVPAFAAVQSWAPIERRARVVAAVNVLNAAYMTGASGTIALLQALGVGVPLLFAVLGVGSFAALHVILKAWGQEGVRDFGRLLFQVFLRLEVKGIENLTNATRNQSQTNKANGVVITPNHVSLLDGPILHAVLLGDAAFAVNTEIAEAAWVKPFLRVIRAHRLDPTRPLAARHLVNAVKDGEMLVMFPEGRITTTGSLMKVYDGAAMIADKAGALVVPVRIEGPERSAFGYLRKSQIKKSWLPKVTVTFLAPRRLYVDPALRGKARRQAAGLALQDILVDTAVSTARFDRTIFDAVAQNMAIRVTNRPAIEDPLSHQLSTRKLMHGAQVLGLKLASLDEEGAAIGLMLPTSAAAAVAFFALQTIGRVPAMINFTAGARSIRAACTAARIRTIITSRAFIDRGRLTPLLIEIGKDVRIVYLEDLRASIATIDKLRVLWRGTKPWVARNPNDAAVILFTSGSEGTPKGVVLSHRNILANIAQCLTRFDANGEDRVFNALPAFHSFGLTAGLLMPLVGGIPIYLYPTPLHYRIIPELVYNTGATILFGTDTFLNGYARAAHPYDFHNIRFIMAGAEPVKDRTRQLYMDRFGVRILEGYGVTETAPVLAMNTLIANKPGSVGRLSPLMEARLETVAGINPTGGCQQIGRLFVRGPNVMLGYYRAERPGVLEPPAGGWHDTGDIVAIDAQGYLAISGRAKRFAKIGGEMVSLSAVEAIVADIWPTVGNVVVAVPDSRKGERLILLTADRCITREKLLHYARAKGASDLMVPGEIVVVDKLPLLGSGKPDYVAASALAMARGASKTGIAAA
jgi:acyl-[acyl-carrier-protein]-phospholipid O-acyltransferase/long-chain-fatty-acid--[acyl-carrier-protein] ligase